MPSLPVSVPLPRLAGRLFAPESAPSHSVATQFYPASPGSGSSSLMCYDLDGESDSSQAALSSSPVVDTVPVDTFIYRIWSFRLAPGCRRYLRRLGTGGSSEVRRCLR